MMVNVSAWKKCCYALLCVAVLSACGGDKDKVEPYANNLGIKPAKLAQIDTAHFTTIGWEKAERDFGTVNEGDSVVYDYAFSNTGKHPLFISAVKPSCGCTVAEYPQKPIMPGESASIHVNFNTSNYPGAVHKTIVVTTNTSNGVKHILSLAGQVIEKQATK